MRFQETVVFIVLLMPQLIILLEYSWYSKLSLFFTLYSSILPLIYLLIHPVLSILIGNTGRSLKVPRLGLDTFTAMVQVQSLAKEIRSRKPCNSAKKKKKKKRRKNICGTYFKRVQKHAWVKVIVSYLCSILKIHFSFFPHSWYHHQ